MVNPGQTTKQLQSMLDWPLYTPSPHKEYLYKVANPGKTTWKNTIYVGLTTLYPLPQ